MLSEFVGDGEEDRLTGAGSRPTESVMPSLQRIVVLCSTAVGFGVVNMILNIVVLWRQPEPCIVPQ